VISIGYKNHLAPERIVAVISPNTMPIRNLINSARERGKLIDATMGKKTKAVIITDSDHVVLSANTTDTITHRILVYRNSQNKSGK